MVQGLFFSFTRRKTMNGKRLAEAMVVAAYLYLVIYAIYGR